MSGLPLGPLPLLLWPLAVYAAVLRWLGRQWPSDAVEWVAAASLGAVGPALSWVLSVVGAWAMASAPAGSVPHGPASEVVGHAFREATVLIALALAAGHAARGERRPWVASWRGLADVVTAPASWILVAGIHACVLAPLAFGLLLLKGSVVSGLLLVTIPCAMASILWAAGWADDR